jgi:hypothetical protein
VQAAQKGFFEMSNATVKTQGTKLYFVDPLTSSVPAIVELGCPTGISGLGGAADQIETTCLSATVDRTFARGLGNPGQVTVPFNLLPSNASHQLLFELSDSGVVVNWLAALSDGTNTPNTLDSNDRIVPPNDRTSFGFDAYIADVNIDIATNEIVRGTLTLQRSGQVTATWN